MVNGERRDFYTNQLIPGLSADVMEAELARQRGDHKAVKAAFDKWVLHQDPTEKEPVSNDQRLIKKLQEDKNLVRGGLVEEEDLIKIGLAGIGRIRHVDLNSLLRRSDVLDQRQLLESIGEVDQLYSRLNLRSLAPWTIHHGSIHWLAEVAQDRVNTQMILGNPLEARQLLHRAVAQVADDCDRLKRVVDLNIPKNEPQTNNYSAYRNRKLYLGSLSALGVLVARRAKFHRYQPDMNLGLSMVSEAYQYEPNPHRLATLALWTIQASLSLDYQKTLRSSLLGLGLGIISYLRAFKDDSNSAISATKLFRK